MAPKAGDEAGARKRKPGGLEQVAPGTEALGAVEMRDRAGDAGQFR
jgi:hypothetical protein